jgi:hypothetical protein
MSCSIRSVSISKRKIDLMIIHPKPILNQVPEVHILKVKDKIPIPIKLAIMQVNKANKILDTQIPLATQINPLQPKPFPLQLYPIEFIPYLRLVKVN